MHGPELRLGSAAFLLLSASNKCGQRRPLRISSFHHCTCEQKARAGVRDLFAADVYIR
jgi:hypothetical protein